MSSKRKTSKEDLKALADTKGFVNMHELVRNFDAKPYHRGVGKLRETRKDKRMAAQQQKKINRQKHHQLKMNGFNKRPTPPAPAKTVETTAKRSTLPSREKQSSLPAKKQRTVEQAPAETIDPLDKEIAYLNKKLGKTQRKSETLDGLNDFLKGLSSAGRIGEGVSSSDDEGPETFYFNPDLVESDDYSSDSEFDDEKSSSEQEQEEQKVSKSKKLSKK